MIVYADDVAAFEARLVELGLQKSLAFDRSHSGFRLEPYWDTPLLIVKFRPHGKGLPSETASDSVFCMICDAAWKRAETELERKIDEEGPMDFLTQDEFKAKAAAEELDRLAFVAKRDGLAWGRFIDAARRKLVVGGAGVAIGIPNAD